MSTHPKISILVPVFNVEKYLKKCLDSLVSQSLKDIEIICINDGSTDDTPKILNKYAKKDSRIRIITKENSGYGDSLNQALKEATGDYIGIIEPDDYIDQEMFAKLVDLAKLHKADIVKGSFYYYYGRTNRNVPEKLFLHGEEEHLLNPINEQSVFLTSPTIWSAIYRRKLLESNDIKFLPTPGASYQDIGFAFKTFAAAKKVYCTNQPFYHYRQDNINSSVKSSGKVYAVKVEFDSIDEYLKDHNLYDSLSETSAACRFRSYMWNYNRLQKESALDFAKTAQKDYRRIASDSNFSASYFSGLERANETKIATVHPALYIHLRPLFVAKNKVLRSLSSVYHRLKP